MCGRFTQVVKARDLAAMYGPAVSMPGAAWAERWNGAPTQAFLACRLDDAMRRVLSLLRWGLVPSWARAQAMGSRLINARSETVHEKPALPGCGPSPAGGMPAFPGDPARGPSRLVGPRRSRASSLVPPSAQPGAAVDALGTAPAPAFPIR